MTTNRRDFIKFVVAGSVAAGCPIDLSFLAAETPQPEVEGEDNRICHQVRDGKISYGRIYADTARGRDVLEGREPRRYPKLILN